MSALRLCGIGDEGAAGLTRQIALHVELGLPAIELRTVDGRGLHQLTEAQADAAAELVAAAGLAVPVVDTPLGAWSVDVGVSEESELEVLRRSARAARRFGCTRLRIMSYPNDGRPEDQWRAAAISRVATLVERAAALGVTLLHENCNGWAGADAERTVELLDAVDGLRLIFDTGNGVAYGYRSLPFLREVLPHVEHVHVKDGGLVDGQAVFGWPGQGLAELTSCVALLRDSGYRGWYSVEPHMALVPHLGTAADPAAREAIYVDYVGRLRRLLDPVHEQVSA